MNIAYKAVALHRFRNLVSEQQLRLRTRAGAETIIVYHVSSCETIILGVPEVRE